MRSIILFGGTFDPIHNGHVMLAEQVTSLIDVEQFFFIPCKQTLLDKQQANASAQDRIAMIKLITEKKTNWQVDDYEVNKTSPSYTVDTLKHYRKHYPDSSLIWLLGMDAFMSLHRWHQSEQLFSYTNFLVANRPDYPFKPCDNLTLLLKKRQKCRPTDLKNQKNGYFSLLDLKESSCASSNTRELIKQKHSYEHTLPTSVTRYIKQKKLYLS